MNISNNSTESEMREVKLSDLLFRILSGWRFIFISTVLFAVVVCGYKYISDRKVFAVTKSVIMKQPTMEEMRAALTEEERNNIEKAELIKKNLDESKEYQEESIWINLNPYTEKKVTLQYMVTQGLPEGGEITNVEEITDAYVYYMSAGVITDLCRELQWDTEQKYISELLSVTQGASNRTFSISIVGEEEQIQKIAEQIKIFVNMYTFEVADKVEEHNLVLIGEYSSEEIDSELLEKKSEVENNIMNLQTNLDSLIAKFTVDQLKIFNGESEEDVQEIEAPMLNVKYLVIGAVLGFLIGCTWKIFSYILNGRLKYMAELQEVYGLRIFGTIVTEKRKKRFFSKIDSWIEKIQMQKAEDMSGQWDIIMINLKMACKKEGIKELYLGVSMQMEERDRNLVEQLIKRLGEVGIKVYYGVGFLCDSKAILQANEAENIVLLEKEQGSRYQMIEQEILFCREQQINLLGVIGMRESYLL